MSGNGGSRLVVNCPHCGSQLGLPFVVYFVGQFVRCGLCYGCTRLTVPNRVFLIGKSAVPYWVSINPPPRPTQEAPKCSSGNSSTNGNVKARKAKSSNTSTNSGNLKAKSSNSSTNNGKSLSTPSQTQTTANDQDTEVENSDDDQDTEDENSEDDHQKPSIVVNGNQVSGNTGDRNGGFSVGNTTKKHTFHARKCIVNVH